MTDHTPAPLAAIRARAEDINARMDKIEMLLYRLGVMTGDAMDDSPTLADDVRGLSTELLARLARAEAALRGLMDSLDDGGSHHLTDPDLGCVTCDALAIARRYFEGEA